MNKYHLNIIASLSIATLSIPQRVVGKSAYNDNQKKNVLFIVVDDLRPELGCYGASHIISPHIDNIAKGGILFNRAYVNIPVSGASRASLLTGLYPDLPHRFASFEAWVEKDAPQAVDIAAWFSSQGYTTLSNGKVFHHIKDRASSWSEYPWRYRPDGYGKDWAEYNKWELWLNDSSAEHINQKTLRGPYCESADVPDSLYDDVQISMRTISDLKRLAKSENPFFLAVGFWRPHLPFNAPKRFWDKYKREDIALSTNRFTPHHLPAQVKGSTEITGYALTEDLSSDDFHREARHGYYACVSFIDEQIGAILNQLRSEGLDKNTIVVIVGDHGWHLGEHEFWGKHNLMNLSTNAPFIMSIPQTEPKVIESIAQFVDIFPTLCSATGIASPPLLQGRDLMPLIKGDIQKVNDYAFIQWGKGISVVSNEFYYALWPATSDSDEAQMLFNMKNDSLQDNNVASDPQYAEQIINFRKEIELFRDRIKIIYK